MMTSTEYTLRLSRWRRFVNWILRRKVSYARHQLWLNGEARVITDYDASISTVTFDPVVVEASEIFTIR